MADDHADLVIWDSTPAGLTAAIAAARAGLRPLIVTEDAHIGGVQTSGLGFTNAGQVPTIGGITREFHNRIRDYYVRQYGDNSPQMRDCIDGFRFEPHVAEAIWEAWLTEAGVSCMRSEVLERVERRGTRITAIHTTSGRRFTGSIFIDASYEGDLIALAGCSYHLGRESSATYGETLAGATYPPDRVGEGDHKIQPFDYRCCLTDDPANRVPFTRPADYDPSRYAWFVAKMRQAGATTLKDALPINWLPNRKTDSRTAEWPGRSWDYIEASRERRAQIERAHRDYSAGYLWFLANDPAVPASIRREAADWGLARDEFTDNSHWPWHIYVREGRRLIGRYVLTQRDCLGDRFKPDSVGLCSWYLDVHPVDLFEVNGEFHSDGLIVQRVRPFEIPWRSLLPREGEAENLLSPVALSASHVAYSAVRVEPVWMILGQASGVGAALSLSRGVPLHALPVAVIQQTLVEQGQVIDARPFNDLWP